MFTLILFLLLVEPFCNLFQFWKFEKVQVFHCCDYNDLQPCSKEAEREVGRAVVVMRERERERELEAAGTDFDSSPSLSYPPQKTSPTTFTEFIAYFTLTLPPSLLQPIRKQQWKQEKKPPSARKDKQLLLFANSSVKAKPGKLMPIRKHLNRFFQAGAGCKATQGK